MRKIFLLSQILFMCSAMVFSGLSYSQPVEEEEEELLQPKPNPVDSRAKKSVKATTRTRSATSNSATRANAQRPEGAPQLKVNRPEGAPQIPAQQGVVNQ